MGKCCHCCSFDSLGCRLRTLKASGSLLIIFGFIFAVAGILIGFVGELYFQQFDVDIPERVVYPKYTLYTILVTSTGFSAVVTGMGAIYIARTMSDDDCSTRGLSILALLTIVCSLASVGVPTWQLYEDGYFIWLPGHQNSTNMTTAMPIPTTVPVALTTLIAAMNNTTASAMNVTSLTMNGTVSANGTDGAATTSAPMGMVNVTVESTDTNSTIATSSANSTSSPQSNATTAAAPDIVTSGAMENAVTMTTDFSNGTMGNSTESGVTREPIYYEEWAAVIAPFGIVCIFAFIFLIFSLLVFCIGCCCAERSEIVDDIDLYKH